MGKLLGAVALLLVASCLQNNLAPCGDHFCPPGKACHEPSGACFGEDQLDACIGVADLAACTIGSFSGYCIDGVCLAARCGDGIVQPEIGENCDEGDANSDLPNADCRTTCQIANCGDGIVDDERFEVCDDGNLDPNDACAPDCGSNLTCGNGIVDLNEECDDSNPTARDGCSACKNEQLVAQQLTGGNPRPRTGGVMAYDGGRERVVMFGGRARGGGFRRDTVEWDGVRWREIKPRNAPSARELAGFAYDAKRHRLMLFGGDDFTLRDDLWEFDGADWREKTVAVKPPGRKSHAMAYDPIHDRMLLLGGRIGPATADVVDDMWAWDGTAWEQLAPAAKPPAMDGAAMVFDPINKQLVLFGGRLADGSLSNLTWLWDGLTWTNPTVTGTPQARFNHTIAWDAARGRVVIVNGEINNFGSPTNTVFEWNGATTTWTAAGIHSFAVAGMSMAYDAARRQMVTVGQNFNTSITRLRSAALATFVNPPQLLSPPARMHSASAWDARHGKMVIFGGHDDQFITSPVETWEWDGARWTVKSIAQAGDPKSRIRPTMTYSHANGIVLTAGSDDGQAVDLWGYDGTSWSQFAPPDSIAFGPGGARFTSSISYDQARNTLLMHGGFDNGEPTTTLEWNGSSWGLVSQAASAGARHNFAMEYDPLRQRTMVVGGHSQAGVLPTAFEFDGTTWTSIVEPPSIGRGSRLVYNTHSHRQVYLVDPEDTGLEIWEYNGEKWTPRDARPALAPLYRPAVAYDQVRGEIVIFGGRSGANGAPANNTTTVVGYQPNIAVEACTLSTLDYDNDGLAGCMDPDCFGRCSPTCLDGAQCAFAASFCGDGTCDPLEDCKLCPTDCAFPAQCPPGTVTECGDFRCDPGEVCPGDCEIP